MRKILITICLITSAILAVRAPSRSCTTFCLRHDGGWIFGRNYDWDVEHGMLFVNKRGVEKQSISNENPVRWVSKYGSVTFNQYGRELPLGGMNETGLVIECMWLKHTEFPNVDSRPQLSELQWIQYQLDKSASIDDVIDSDSRVRIDSRNSQPLHFLVCDGNGGCAAIEFLSGRMVVHKGDELPVTAMTNNTYEYSVQFVNTCEGDENSTAFASGSYSNKRFFWAASGIKDWEDQPSSSPVDYAFDILEKVSQDHTVFRIVYDVGNRRIYFRTLSNPAVKHFDYGAFDFSCATPVKMLDMASELHGDVTALFSDYEYDANYDLIAAAFRETEFLKHIPETTLRYIAAYPESLQCVVR